MFLPRDLSDADLALLARRAERELLQVPAWATQRALAIAQDAAAARPGTPLAGALRQWVASLHFDSWQAQPQATLRSPSAASRQLLFSVGNHDIDLRVQGVEQRPGFIQLSGQVLGPAATGQLRWQAADGAGQTGTGAGAGEGAGETALDELGEFHVPQLPAGVYRLTLQLADALVELPPLDLQPTRPV